MSYYKRGVVRQSIKMRLKAQIKMGETMAVLIIFFFLLMFGFAFYAKVQEKLVGDRYKENINLQVLQVTKKASYLPELQCSVLNVREDNCFDVHKVEVFYDLVKDNRTYINQYHNIFGFSDIILQEVYPGDSKYMIYNSSVVNASQTLSSRVPVSIFDGGTDRYSIGLLIINYSVVQR